MTLQSQLVANGATNLGTPFTNGQRIDQTDNRAWDDATGNFYDAYSSGEYNIAAFNTEGTDLKDSETFNVGPNNWSLIGGADITAWGFTQTMVANIDLDTEKRTLFSLGNDMDGRGFTYLDMNTDNTLTLAYFGMKAGWNQDLSVTSTATITDGDHVFTVLYEANQLELFVDGISFLKNTLVSGATLNNQLNQYGLGGTADSTVSGLGTAKSFSIAEHRIYSDALTTGELNSMHSDLMATYGIVPEPTTTALLLGGAALGLVMIRRRRS